MATPGVSKHQPMNSLGQFVFENRRLPPESHLVDEGAEGAPSIDHPHLSFPDFQRAMIPGNLDGLLIVDEDSSSFHRSIVPFVSMAVPTEVKREILWPEHECSDQLRRLPVERGQHDSKSGWGQ